MQSTYDPTIDRVIHRYEGPYGWNRKDPGGPTKYGITCFDLAEHRGQKMDSMTRWAPIVAAMPLSEAEDIYWSKYATGLRYNDLRAGVDACMLDYGINSGVSRPVHSACAILSLPAVGALTTDLVAAINEADPAWFINAMCQERLAFMHGIRGGSAWAEFGHGWEARVNDVETYSKALAQGISGPVPLPVPTAPKATHTDPRLGKKTVATGSGSAPVAAGAAHAAGASAWIAVAIFAAIVGVLAVLYFIQKARNDRANATVILPLTIPPQSVMHVTV